MKNEKKIKKWNKKKKTEAKRMLRYLSISPVFKFLHSVYQNWCFIQFRQSKSSDDVLVRIVSRLHAYFTRQ